MNARKWIALFLALFLVFSIIPSTGSAEPLVSPPNRQNPAKSSVKKAFLSILHPEPVPGGLTSEDLENAILTSCFDRKLTQEPKISLDMKEGIITGICDLTLPDEAGKMYYVAKVDGNFKPQGKEITFTLKSEIESYGTLRVVKEGKELGIWEENHFEATKYTAAGEWSSPEIGIGNANFNLTCLVYMKNVEGNVPYGVGGRCPGSKATSTEPQSDDGSGTGKVTWRLDLVDTCGDTLKSFSAKSDSQIKIVSIEGEQVFLDASVIRDGCEVEAEKGMQLKQDDQVITGYKTFMYIDLFEHKIIIPPMSGINIRTFFMGDVKQIEAELFMGSISTRTIKQFRPTRFSVKNPTLTASSRGTTFTVSYDPEQKISTVQVAEGIVDVTPVNPALAPVMLEANQQVTVSQNDVGAVQPYSPPPDVQPSSFSLRAWFAGERMWMVLSLLVLLGILLMGVGIALLRRRTNLLGKVIAFAVVLLPGAAVSSFALLSLFR